MNPTHGLFLTTIVDGHPYPTTTQTRLRPPQIKVKTLKEAAVELSVTGATTVGELKALIEQSACVWGI